MKFYLLIIMIISTIVIVGVLVYLAAQQSMINTNYNMLNGKIVEGIDSQVSYFGQQMTIGNTFAPSTATFAPSSVTFAQSSALIPQPPETSTIRIIGGAKPTNNQLSVNNDGSYYVGQAIQFDDGSRFTILDIV
jgi:hypothetical protein